MGQVQIQGKRVSANFISSTNGPVKVQEQGRDETCKKPTPAVQAADVG